jgi:hypothetical protein
MAFYSPANGDAQPVFAIDTLNGPIAPSTSTSATPVNLAGPKLDFFQITCANTNATLQGTNGYVANVIRAVQQTSTVAIYQVDGAQISLAVFPTGVFTNATILAAAQTANAAGVNGAASATGVGIGFKLATS